MTAESASDSGRPPTPADRRTLASTLAGWCLPPLLVLLFVWLGLGGTGRDFGIPVFFLGDALFYLVQSKTTLDHGWWWWNPSIGVPTGYHALVFAQNTNIDQGIVRLVGLFTRDVGLAVNVAWMLMLAVSAATARWCLRQLGISRLGSAVAGVLFAVSPFAFYRNISHFNLVTYLVPFGATAALLLASAPHDRAWKLPRRGVLLAGCVLLGLNYVYYPFFASILILVGALIGFARTRMTGPLTAGGLCLAAIVLATALNLIPNGVAWHEFGQPRGVQHGADESETFGLKIRHLISPVMHHWFPPFQSWYAREVQISYPADNENGLTRLGLVATVGFLGLLGTLIVPAGREQGEGHGMVRAAAALTAAAVLVATVGGFSSVFSLLVSSNPFISGSAPSSFFAGGPAIGSISSSRPVARLRT
jgi:phosphoglycerol transferase